MAETKATRLEQLSELVSVPFFKVLVRGEEFVTDGSPQCQYMVRSSSVMEDRADFSNAGQLTTLGPVPLNQVPASMAQVWKDAAVNEIIVQQYIDAEQWGVAFCFSEQSILVEYSGIFEGVTTGAVNPFTALLPSTIPRYQELQQQLLKIYHRFGPCDVEFVNLENPQFVQVRPITRDIEFDEQFIGLKMKLQELETESWHENDVCRMLSERDEYSQALSTLYLQAVENVYRKYLNKNLTIPEPTFLKISEQYFMAASLEQQLKAGTWGTIRLAFKLPALITSVRNRTLKDYSLAELMEKSILISLAYDLNRKQELFELRENVRIELEQRMTPGKINTDLHYADILSDTIHFDKKQACWHQLDRRDKQGITVVPGDLDSGPYFHLEQREQEIPAGVIVITRQLYPEIGQSIADIKGIICQYGSLSAHVAILAREYQVPLKIQAPIDGYE